MIHNYYPLLVWALLFFPLNTSPLLWGNDMNKENSESAAIIYLVGCVFWFILGSLCNLVR